MAKPNPFAGKKAPPFGKAAVVGPKGKAAVAKGPKGAVAVAAPAAPAFKKGGMAKKGC